MEFLSHVVGLPNDFQALENGSSRSRAVSTNLTDSSDFSEKLDPAEGINIKTATEFPLSTTSITTFSEVVKPLSICRHLLGVSADCKICIISILCGTIGGNTGPISDLGQIPRLVEGSVCASEARETIFVVVGSAC
jgi:hypothetical protein